jgi:hypothetical protein
MSFYDDASWLLIPSGIKEDVVFAQKPTSGLGDLTFTRASDATYTDSTGVVRRSPYNLLQQSEDFSNAAWSKSASSISSNVTTAPNGTLTADKLIEDTANTSHTIFQTISISASTNYNYSVYLKAAERFRFRIRFTGFSGAQDATVNLNTQTTSLGTLTSVGNGWFRFAWSVNSGAGGSSTLVAITLQDDSGNSTYLGNGTSGGFIWGAQLVEGNEALDYFPTTNRQDVPRIDFRNADGTLSSCGRLLLEPQRTNLVPNGLLFNSTTGVSYDSSITASPAPGVQNATRITKNEAAGNVRYPNQNASATLLAGSSVYTLSRYFKYDGFDFQTTMEYNNAGNWGGVSWTVPINISATAITIGTPSACTATIVNMGSGWYRVTVTITTGVTIVGFPTYLMRLPSTLSTGQGFLTALPQFELGAYATTFIPTTTAAVTRLADTFTRSNVFTNGFITAAGGTWFVDLSNQLELARSASTAGIYIDTGIGGFTNGFTIRNTGTISQRLNIAKWVSNVGTSLFTTTTNNIKLAIKWNGTTADVFVNGVKVVSATAFTTTAMQRMDGDGVDVPRFINQMALFPTPLTDAQCIQLTT